MYYIKPTLKNLSQGARLEYIRKFRHMSLDDVAEYFGYLLVAGQTIPVYTIVNDKTLSEIELNKFLEYNVNKVMEYYNDFKEEKHGIKKDSKRYLAK